MNILSSAGLGLILCALAGLLTGRVAFRHVFGLQALGFLLITAAAAFEGAAVNSGICAAIGLGLAWVWWTGGGDDDIKGGRRRLRRTSRRTAPPPA